MVVGFVGGVGVGVVGLKNGVCGQRVGNRVAKRSVVKMSGEEQSDLKIAQDCLEEGCEINEVQELLGRLQMKKQALEEEVEMLSIVMGNLAKANLSKDRGFVAEAVEAAIGLFQRAEDSYPKVGSPTPWSMDKPSKKKSNW